MGQLAIQMKGSLYDDEILERHVLPVESGRLRRSYCAPSTEGPTDGQPVGRNLASPP